MIVDDYGLGTYAAEVFASSARPVLVEGPMDVLAVNRAATSPASGGAQAHAAVAPCGTALTGQQVQLLDTVTGGLAECGVAAAPCMARSATHRAPLLRTGRRVSCSARVSGTPPVELAPRSAEQRAQREREVDESERKQGLGETKALDREAAS